MKIQSNYSNLHSLKNYTFASVKYRYDQASYYNFFSDDFFSEFQSI